MRHQFFNRKVLVGILVDLALRFETGESCCHYMRWRVFFPVAVKVDVIQPDQIIDGGGVIA